jgi:hypothetical protein
MNSQERLLNRRFVRFSCSLVRERRPNRLGSHSNLLSLYLLRVKSALLSPDAATVLDWFLAPSCQAVTV